MEKDDFTKEKTSLVDHIGSLIGIIVIGFILFILAWPLIDPTPNKSSTLKENAKKLTN
jgi:hypothetical protein